MVQLILDVGGANIELPESRKGGYTAALVPLSEYVQMISGRMVAELRGNVWEVSYQYGYFNDEMKNKVLAAAEKGRTTPITCGFLPPDSTAALTYSRFFVTDFTYPKFMWSRNVDGNPVPLWGDFSLILREVDPHD